ESFNQLVRDTSDESYVPFLIGFYAFWAPGALTFLRFMSLTVQEFDDLSVALRFGLVDLSEQNQLVNRYIDPKKARLFPFLILFTKDRETGELQQTLLSEKRPSPQTVYTEILGLGINISTYSGEPLLYQPYGVEDPMQVSGVFEGPYGHMCSSAYHNLTDNTPTKKPQVKKKMKNLKKKRDWPNRDIFDEIDATLPKDHGIPVVSHVTWSQVVEKSHAPRHPFLPEGRWAGEYTKVAMIVFLIDGCGSCRRNMDVFRELHETVKYIDGGSLYLANCTRDRQLCVDHGVTGFPTILAFRGFGWLGDGLCVSSQAEREIAESIRMDYHGVILVKHIMEWFSSVASPAVNNLKFRQPPVMEVVKSHLHDSLKQRQAPRFVPSHPEHWQVFGGQSSRDASLKGWGAHFLHQQMARLWSSAEQGLHINELKYLVLLAIQHWAKELRGSSLLIQSDNSTVTWYINHLGSTGSANLLQLTFRFFHLIDSLVIDARSRHIPGVRNVVADALSRSDRPSPTEWQLNPQIFRELVFPLSRPQVDLFTARFNHPLPMFVSPITDLLAWDLNALDEDVRLTATLMPKYSRYLPKSMQTTPDMLYSYQCYRLSCERLYGQSKCYTVYNIQVPPEEYEEKDLDVVVIKEYEEKDLDVVVIKVGATLCTTPRFLQRNTRRRIWMCVVVIKVGCYTVYNIQVPPEEYEEKDLDVVVIKVPPEEYEEKDLDVVVIKVGATLCTTPRFSWKSRRRRIWMWWSSRWVLHCVHTQVPPEEYEEKDLDVVVIKVPPEEYEEKDLDVVVIKVALERSDGMRVNIMQTGRYLHHSISEELGPHLHTFHKPHRYNLGSSQKCEDDHSACTDLITSFTRDHARLPVTHLTAMSFHIKN
ncbi:uncharacterized protein LOC124279975, partial [Haliotis rubra]|uniref:uncharacterized protein LOC124279975 n=1 Tax=Haliotis rubra TaxID=36100 RepID=UPI001EE5E88F